MNFCGLAKFEMFGVAVCMVVWCQAAGVGREVDISLAGIDSSRPLWEVIQAMNWKDYHPINGHRTGSRWPSANEQRSMTWQAVCRGANGIAVRCATNVLLVVR
jgi:hypothetical protein